MNLDLSKLKPGHLVRYYLELREARRTLVKEVKDIQVKLDFLEHILRLRMDQLGTDSFSSLGHTTYKSVLRRVKVEDREAFFDFVVENNAVGMLEARASKDGVLAWMEQHPGEVPGIVFTDHVNINVRKGS